jgi:TolA-binding protein
MRLFRTLLTSVLLTAPYLAGIAQPFPADLNSDPGTAVLYERAMRHASNDEAGVARLLFDSLLAQQLPRSLRLSALMNRAICLRALGDPVGADIDYDRVARDYPRTVEHVEALRERGRIAYDRLMFQDARTILHECVNDAAMPHLADSLRARAIGADAWYWIGKCYIAYDSSAALMRDTAHGDELLFQRGLLSDRDGDNAGAAGYYLQLTTNFSSSPYALLAHLHRAHSLVAVKNYSLAATAAEDAAHLLPQAAQRGVRVPEDASAQLSMLRGEIAGGMGNFVAAGVELGHALGFPHGTALHRRILFALGWSAYRAGAMAEAITYFDSLVNMAGSNDELIQRAQFLAAIAAERNGDTVASATRLQAIAESGENRFTPDAYLELALQHAAAGDWNALRRDADRAMKRGRGTSVHARAEIVKGEEALGRSAWTDAATSFRNALTVLARVTDTPEDSLRALRLLARARLGYALVRADRAGEAVPVLAEFIGSAGEHPLVPEAIFWMAEAHYDIGALQNAREMYKRYIDGRYTPHREDALYGMGWSDFRMRRFAQAQQSFQRMVREFPKSKLAVDALLRGADGLYLGRDFSGAAAAYEAATKRSGKGEASEYAMYQQAQCYMKLGQRPKAIETLRSFVASRPGSRLAPEATYLIGWNLFEDKRYDEAVAAMSPLVGSGDSGIASKALYTIGDAQYNAGNYEGALTSYDKLVTAFPSSQYVDAALASEQYCLSFLGRDSLAAMVVPRFVELHPDLPAAHDLAFKQGDVFYNSQRYDDAVKEFAGVAKKFGSSQEGATATYWMGKSYLNLGDTTQAIEAFTIVRTRFPAFPITATAMYDLALVHAAKGEKPRAVEIFTALRKQFPTTQDAANAAVECAAILLRVPDTDTAKAVALLRDGSDGPATLEATARARILLGMVLDAQGSTDEAAQLFAQVAQRGDGLGAEAQYRLGESGRVHGSFDDAIAALLRVKAEFGAFEPWLTESLLALGSCYEATSRPELARESYQTVLAFHQDDDAAKEAQARMKKVKAK